MLKVRPFAHGAFVVLMAVNVMAAPVLAAPNPMPRRQSAGWLDPAWTQRTPVMVNNTGGALANYQVQISLDASFDFGHANPDGSDIRVTAADGTTLLPMWVEQWTPNTSASIWVKTPSLPAGGYALLYLYYGNAAAAPVSDGASVFEFYDNFEAPFGELPLVNAATHQTTPTYDGSGQIVHPGIVYFPSGWHGYEYWLVVTPYPYGDSSKENPSILVSHDGQTWVEPPGIDNPLTIPTTSYLADADLFYDEASDQLWVYYPHQVMGGRTYAIRKVSSDGVNWGDQYEEIDLFDVPDFEFLSPAVLKVGSTYWMWSVNSGPAGCSSAMNQLQYRTSDDGFNWSAPTNANFSVAGYSPWHVDMIYVPSKSEFWSVISAYPQGAGCGNTVLLFARSADGINWTTYSRVALGKGTSGAWDSGQIYRSTLLYDPATDLLKVWYSANNGSAWWQGYTERNYTQFLSAVSAGGGDWAVEGGSGSWSRSNERFKRDGYSGKLVQNAGANMVVTKPQPAGSNFYQEWDFFDDLDDTAFKQVRVRSGNDRVGIGVWTVASVGYYAYHDRSYNYYATSVARTVGWHKLGIRLTSGGAATYYIDGQQVGSLTGQFTSASVVDIEGYESGGATTTTFYVDDVRIRKYASPEPTVSLTGPPSNQAPIAANDTYFVEQDHALNVTPGSGVLNNDTDADGNPLTARLASGPSHGALSLSAGGSFVYTPTASYLGADQFTYIAFDGISDSVPALVTINVRASTAFNPANWAHRRPVTVNNPATAQTDYQVRVALDTTNFDFGQAKSDGTDIRFTAADGATLLPYWIETWTSSAATLWVKAPSLPAGGNTTLYLYYGNPSAGAVSNGNDTFAFFDGFEFATGPALTNAATYQTLPTYEGSGQAIHPAIVYFANGWHGYRYWLAMTPLPNGNGVYQNPSILVSNDGATWAAPTGLTNPVASTTTGNLADPDLYYDAATDQLWLYYINEASPTQYLRRKTSTDGVTWSAEQTVFNMPSYQFLSPAVEKIGNTYYLWYVNAGAAGCSATSTTVEYRTSTDGLNWSAAQTAGITQPGYYPFHVEVIRVPSKNEYWMLSMAYPAGSNCSNTVLYFARSTNGINWTTYGAPALGKSASGWDRGQIFRATGLYDETTDVFKVWYSANDATTWHTGYTERAYADFANALAAGAAWTSEGGTSSFTRSTEQSKRGSYAGKFVQAGSGSSLFSKPQPLPNNFVQEWDMYDDLDTTAFKIVRVTYAVGTQIGMGVWTGSSTTNYAYHRVGYTYDATSAPRTVGWHKFGIRLTPDSTATYFVDNGQVGSLGGQFNNAAKVTVEGLDAGPTTYHVDDIRVRKYASPEPAATVGAEVVDGADIGVTQSDSPDPVKIGATLTYVITVTNNGPANAAGVVVTDALPANVALVSATPSQGSCSGTTTVVCSLGNLNNGASAFVTILVTPNAVGTLTNNVSAASSAPDANTANNSQSITTFAGDPVVYAVIAIDTEADNNHPMGAYHTVFDVHNYQRAGGEVSEVMNSAFRNANRDSLGTPFKMSWYLEMDNYINNGLYADGRPMSYLTLYDELTRNWSAELSAWDDELAYHHHFMYWTGSGWVGSSGETALNGYDYHNEALDRMVLDARFFPANFRSGWLWTSNQLQAWIEPWFIADYSNAPWGGAPSNWVPYHPSAANYTQPGSMNHWIARCDTGPNQTSISAAFAEALARGGPVVYCWYAHQRDDMSGQIASAQSMLAATAGSTGVPFRYATSRQAMQAIINTTDTTPPALAITPAGGEQYTITSNEAVWGNRPYVAAKYIAAGGLGYTHTVATVAGTNTWQATIPDQLTVVTTIPGQRYSLVAASASNANAGYPATNVIDGNPDTYWDSTSQVVPAWVRVDMTETKPVKMLTVHFYDGDARQYSYYVEGSTDGTTWTEIVPNNTVHGLATHVFTPSIELRYARVTVTDNIGSSNKYAHVREVALYDSLDTYTAQTLDLQSVGAGANDLAGNGATAVHIVRPLADLALDVVGLPGIVLNEPLVYTLTVTNQGPSAATNVKVTDTLPAGVTLTSVTPSQGACSGAATVMCDLGSLADRASASVVIVASVAAVGAYVNEARVSSDVLDVYQANNAGSATTTVANPKVYAVIAVDTEADNNHPMGTYHTVFDVHNYQRAGGDTTFSRIMAPSFRDANRDSFGGSLKMSWYMEMDNFINQGLYADGREMHYLTLYDELMNNWGGEVRGYGDEIAYHHHFMYWNGTTWVMSSAIDNYDYHNDALDRMVLDAGFFPTNFRSGWLWTNNQVHAWIEQWMLADMGGSPSSWYPYHPSATNYAAAGDMNHWIARCPGGPDQAGVDSAFAEARNTGKSVIYCVYMHQRDDMAGIVAGMQDLLEAASQSTHVPFVHATSKQAMQEVMEMTDATPPVLALTADGAGNTTITSNETLWGDHPYVAARYESDGTEAYTHTAATPTGPNTWTAQPPAVLTVTVPPAAYTPAGATSSHASLFPASYAIDGNPETYWDSTSQAVPVWIQVALTEAKPVQMLTVHFYDGDARTYDYSIDTSTDGSTWTPLVPNTTVHGLATHTFASAVSLRYVRVTVTNNSVGTFAHIREIALYGSTEPTTTTLRLKQVGAAGMDRSGNTAVVSQTIGAVHTIPLQAGWNLVSFDLNPSSPLITEVLSSIAGQFDLVYAWNAAAQNWRKYDATALPYANTLATLDAAMGFWIHITSTNPVLTITGNAPASTDISLSIGWNMVGYPSAITRALPGALAGTGFTLAYAYHASEADPWKLYDIAGLPWANDLTALSPGWGYWVRTTSASEWHVSYSTP